MSHLAPLFSSARGNWTTPRAVYDALDEEFGFTLDPAPPEEPFELRQDGLVSSWQGEVVFLNPPYGRPLNDWMRKAHLEALGGATVVCLVPSRTDTAWWHEYVLMAAEIRFIRGRLKFGGAKNGAPFPSAIVIFRPS